MGEGRGGGWGRGSATASQPATLYNCLPLLKWVGIFSLDASFSLKNKNMYNLSRTSKYFSGIWVEG